MRDFDINCNTDRQFEGSPFFQGEAPTGGGVKSKNFKEIQ